jgi:hypothetical protein
MRIRKLVGVVVAFAFAIGAQSATALNVTWMQGAVAPGTPARYDKVGVLKVGAPSARNVLVLEPGTSAAAAYFVPLAKWIVSKLPGWQVWAVQRRESLLEDQSELNLAKQGRANAVQVFDYYLGWITDKSVTDHMPAGFLSLAPAYAKDWGMNVAVGDLRNVIGAAMKLGGKVVLGGHSLGGSVVTAYATWDFGGRAGADALSGLVYDDGGSGPAESASAAHAALTQLDAPSATPWLAFGGIAAPFDGLLDDAGAMSVLQAPNAPSLGQQFPLLPANLKPIVPVTNEAQYGYALNVGTSPTSLIAAQAHLGRGVSTQTINGYHTWDGAGAITPIVRYAQMFAGAGILNAPGAEWYFPQRLALDTAAVGNGLANPAQRVLDLHSTMGRRLPHSLEILAICTALGRSRVLAAARALARQSGIPARNLTLINRQSTYAHNDPAGAYPDNAFFDGLVPFLRRVAKA